MARRKKPVTSNPTLFPIPRKAVWIDPTSLGTADAGPVCRCDDSCLYATKGTKHHAYVPHTEWFCTHLAELVAISSPPCAVIEMPAPASELVFGSRWEGGVLPPNQPWWAEVKSGKIPLANIKAALSRIYAFDLFIHNVDRHATNFIMRAHRAGHALIANDYSRAWIVHGFPLPGLPMVATEKTIGCQRAFSAPSGFGTYIEPPEARAVMEKIKQIPTAKIRAIIESHPKAWLPDKIKNSILGWWNTGGMNARAEEVAKGIENGTYL